MTKLLREVFSGWRVPCLFIHAVKTAKFICINKKQTMKNISGFHLPSPGILEPNGPDDPLPYYYAPVIGRIFQARIQQGLELLEPRYGSILEVGFGSGVMLPSLSRLGDAVFGIDLKSDPERVERIMTRLGVQCRLRQGDFTRDILWERKFDLVVAMSVMEHIKDPAPVFERLYHLMNPSGQLLIGMPRVDKFMEKAFAAIGFKGIEKHHVTDRTKCVAAAKSWFRLKKSRHLPAFLPEQAGIYFNMLFEKRSQALSDETALSA